MQAENTVSDPAVLELIKVVRVQLEDFDQALSQLKEKVKIGAFDCSDKEVLLGRISMLRTTDKQVLFLANNPVPDIKTLRFLCAFACAVFDSASWLFKSAENVPVELRLEKIKVNELPNTVSELEGIVKKNQKTLEGIKRSVDRITLSWYKRTLKAIEHYARLVSKYSFESKVFGVVGGSAIGIYLLYYLFVVKKKRAFVLNERNKYKGIVVTPENLYHLLPHADDELQQKLNQWFIDNADAWHALVRQNGYLANIREKYYLAHLVIQKKQLQCKKSHGNFVFTFPDDPRWLLKISGPANRACLQVAAQDKPYGRIDLVDTSRLVPTYQTTSRLFHGLKLKEAVQKYRLDQIDIVDQRLWSPLRSICDEDVVVLERLCKNFKLLRDCSNSELSKIFTKERLRQLLLATKHAGLWNLTKDNIAFNVITKKLIILDTEQPNTTKPSQAFNKDAKRYLHNVCSGVQSLYDLLPKDSEARKNVRIWAKKDPEVMKAPNIKDLLKKWPLQDKKKA